MKSVGNVHKSPNCEIYHLNEVDLDIGTRTQVWCGQQRDAMFYHNSNIFKLKFTSIIISNNNAMKNGTTVLTNMAQFVLWLIIIMTRTGMTTFVYTDQIANCHNRVRPQFITSHLSLLSKLALALNYTKYSHHPH